MRLVPLGDKVIIRPIEEEEQTAGGILLPDTAREQPQIGRVLSVGDGRRLANGTLVPHQVHEGERVVYHRYAGNQVEIDGEELLIMSEDDILAVLES